MTPRSWPIVLLTAVLLALLALAPAAAGADCPKTSLPEIEDEVMCPICGVPLVNAGGQQAENEREFIRELVDDCKSKAEIKAALIEEYGDEVLSVPAKEGFGLAAYIVPVAGVALAAIALAIGAMRWRRRRDDESRGDDGAGDGRPADESAPDLEADLRKYDL